MPNNESAVVFIRSHKTPGEYGDVVGGYYLFNVGEFTELLARLVGVCNFINKVSDVFKVISK